MIGLTFELQNPYNQTILKMVALLQAQLKEIKLNLNLSTEYLRKDFIAQ